jgi:predicted thioesterase
MTSASRPTTRKITIDGCSTSPVGIEVEVVAVLERVTGRRLEFAMR